MKFVFIGALVIANLTSFAQDSVRVYRHSIEVGGRLESYQNPYNDRTYSYLQYGRKINRLDAFARVLHFTLGTRSGIQGETDLYLKFRQKGYGYFSATYSGSELLPNYRLRSEV